MPDLSQARADLQAAAIDLESTPAPSAPAGTEKVTLRHPHTGDVQQVDAKPDQITRWLIRGYAQMPASPAKGK